MIQKQLYWGLKFQMLDILTHEESNSNTYQQHHYFYILIANKKNVYKHTYDTYTYTHIQMHIT